MNNKSNVSFVPIFQLYGIPSVCLYLSATFCSLLLMAASTEIASPYSRLTFDILDNIE